MHDHRYICTDMYIRTYVRMYVVCMYVRMYVHMYVYIRMYVFKDTCMHVMYTCMN